MGMFCVYFLSKFYHVTLIIAKTQFKDNQNMIIWDTALNIYIEIMNYFFCTTRDMWRYKPRKSPLKDNSTKLGSMPPKIF